MKKIIIFFLILIIISIEKVNAQTYKLTLEKQEGIYYVRKGDILPYKSSQFSIYKLDGITAYCIEPSHNITTFNYHDSGEEMDLPYSDELKEKISLIGYYGREYPNHNHVYYSMAAQALIWELTGTGEVSFWTEKDGKGDEIDINKEKKEILQLVEKHSKIPNIKNIDLEFGIEKTITDDLFKDYIVSDDGGISSYKGTGSISIEGNKLKITSRVIGNTKITLKKQRYDDSKSIIFVGDDNNSQTLARLRFQKDICFDINVHTNGVKIKIIKLTETNNSVLQEGIKFKIRNVDTNKEYIYETDKNGIVITNGFDFGTYEISEVEDQIVKGFIWNSNKYIVNNWQSGPHFYDTNIGYYLQVKFYNKRVKGLLEVNKLGEEVNVVNNNIAYSKINLGDITFNLYNEQNELLGSYVTDNNGYFKCENLNVGKYYLIEQNSDDNYITNNKKYYFEIKQDNQYDEIIKVHLNINNYLKKGTLDFTKSDLVTSEGIPNTIIEIYKDDKLFLTRKTDNEGKIIIEKLPIGDYYIIEKEANTMYQLTNEKVFFEVKENGEIVKANMTNERKEIEVPKTDRYDNNILSAISLLVFAIGFIGNIYEKKKAH